MGCLETPYVTPEGWHDLPFMFVTNCNALTNTQDYANLTQPMDGSPFLLRRICGLNNTAGYFQYYNAALSQVFGDQAIVNGRTAQFGVLPEKYYPGNGHIRFDLGVVTKATLSSGEEIAYIGWQGVKRLRGNPVAPAVFPPKWRAQTQVYAVEIGPITWTNLGSPRRYQINIDDYDFVCTRITQVETSAAGIVSEGQPVTGLLAYRFYDYSGQQALSNIPIPDLLCIDTTLPLATGVGAQQNQGTFPVPPMVYPVGSQIIIDAAALRAAAVEDSVQLAFHGFNRIRC